MESRNKPKSQMTFAQELRNSFKRTAKPLALKSVYFGAVLSLVGIGLNMTGWFLDISWGFTVGTMVASFALGVANVGFMILVVQWWRSRSERPRLSPESFGALLGMLVPRSIRARCFEPFLEDLKADRAEKTARTASRRVKRWIEFCFYFRLAVTVVQSLVCYLGDLVAKIAPFIRALFFKGGS